MSARKPKRKESKRLALAREIREVFMDVASSGFPFKLRSKPGAAWLALADFVLERERGKP